MSAKLAIVIVNWNKKTDLANLLASLHRYRYDRHTIFVVDNASTDDSVLFVRETYPAIRVLFNPHNLGGSGGFNTGLRAVLAEDFAFVWLLDNDATVCENALEPLLAAMDSDPRIALAGSKIRHLDNPELISEIGARLHPRTLFTMPQYENVYDRDVPPNTLLDVDYVAACSMLARITAVRELGIWEDGYFLLWDDMEWGVRFKHHGYRVVACTDSAVIHRGFSERVFLPGFFYYAFRNHLYFAAKSYQGIKRWYYLIWLFGALSYLTAMFGVYRHTQAYQDNARQGIDDFVQGRQGQSPLPGNLPKVPDLGAFACAHDKRFLVHATLPAVDIQRMMAAQAPQQEAVTLLVGEHRRNLFAWYGGAIKILGRDSLADIPHDVRLVKFITDRADPLLYQISDNIVTLDMQGNVIDIERLSPQQRRRRVWYLKWLKWTSFLRGAWRGLHYCLRNRHIARSEN